MPNSQRLNPRRILAYNRLQAGVAALVFVTRVARPGGALGPATIRACNRLITMANRLYGREVDIPNIRLLIEDEVFTQADLSLLAARLSAAGQVFEARYAHHTEAGLRQAEARATQYAETPDPDGFPSKHA